MFEAHSESARQEARPMRPRGLGRCDGVALLALALLIGAIPAPAAQPPLAGSDRPMELAGKSTSVLQTVSWSLSDYDFTTCCVS